MVAAWFPGAGEKEKEILIMTSTQFCIKLSHYLVSMCASHTGVGPRTTTTKNLIMMSKQFCIKLRCHLVSTPASPAGAGQKNHLIMTSMPLTPGSWGKKKIKKKRKKTHLIMTSKTVLYQTQLPLGLHSWGLDKKKHLIMTSKQFCIKLSCHLVSTLCITHRGWTKKQPKQTLIMMSKQFCIKLTCHKLS